MLIRRAKSAICNGQLNGQVGFESTLAHLQDSMAVQTCRLVEQTFGWVKQGFGYVVQVEQQELAVFGHDIAISHACEPMCTLCVWQFEGGSCCYCLLAWLLHLQVPLCTALLAMG